MGEKDLLKTLSRGFYCCRTEGMLYYVTCTGSASAPGQAVTRSELDGRGPAGGVSGLYGAGGSRGHDVVAMLLPDGGSGPVASQVAEEISRLLPSLATKHVDRLATHVVRAEWQCRGLVGAVASPTDFKFSLLFCLSTFWDCHPLL